MKEVPKEGLGIESVRTEENQRKDDPSVKGVLGSLKS